MDLKKIFELFGEIPWADIITAAAVSKFGLVALALIIFGVVVITLFRNANDNKVRLIAFGMLLLGAASLIYVVGDRADNAATEIQRKKKLEAKLAECKMLSTPTSHSCKAYDKSGIHSSPSDYCILKLTAGQNRFFADLSVVATKEYYRNLIGATAVQATKPQMATISGIKVPIAFSGRIGCTNAAGTGRTCESRATITAVSFPNSCVQFHKNLRR